MKRKDGRPWVAFDTETWLIQPGRLAPPLVCLSAAVPEHGILCDPREGLRKLEGWLSDGQTILVGHNVAYDLAVCAAAEPRLLEPIWMAYTDGRVRDTKVRDQLRMISLGRYKSDPDANGAPPRFSLTTLALRWLGVDLSSTKVSQEGEEDPWRFRYHELSGLPLEVWPEEAKAYALMDAEVTRDVYARQLEDGDGEDLPDEIAQVNAAWALHLAGAWGYRTDPAAVAALDQKLRRHLEDAKGVLVASGIWRATGSKNMTVIGGMIEEALGGATPYTPTGRVKTDADTLKATPCTEGACEGETVCGNPLHVLASVAEDSKELSTYMPALEAGTRGVINPSYQVLVETGRTSCRAPNVQNQPRRSGVRECIVPREGMVFIGADYAAAELVALAQVLVDCFGESAMADAINAGQDLHVLTAGQILGLDYAEALEAYKGGDKDVKRMRQLAKALNFGLPGGLGAQALVDYARSTWGVNLSVEEAQAHKATWLARYPEMRAYFDQVSQWVDDGGGSFDLSQPRSGRVRGGVGYTNGCNSPFQGLVADGAKAALVHASLECYTEYRMDRGTLRPMRSPLFGCRPVFFVHDEIIAEAPEDRAADAAERLAHVMVQDLRVFCPDVRVEASPYLMRRWYKGAETVRNSEGTLIPWEPTT